MKLSKDFFISPRFAVPAICILITTIMSIFVVKETETIFVVEFGKVVKIVTTPGMHVKIPFVQEIVSFDKRVAQADSPARELISLDQKRLIVDAYAKYKIVNPQIFFQSLKDDRGADMRVKSILDSSMRQVVASYPMSALLTERRSQIIGTVKELLSKQITAFGLQVLDVRIIRADLPVENSEAIFSRMRTEREKEAKELRAQGIEEARTITSDADKQVRQIIAEATMKADIISGKAEAQASRTYAQSFSKDEEFFKFYKTMSVYKTALNKNNTRMILSTDNEFLKGLADKK